MLPAFLIMSFSFKPLWQHSTFHVVVDRQSPLQFCSFHRSIGYSWKKKFFLYLRCGLVLQTNNLQFLPSRSTAEDCHNNDNNPFLLILQWCFAFVIPFWRFFYKTMIDCLSYWLIKNWLLNEVLLFSLTLFEPPLIFFIPCWNVLSWFWMNTISELHLKHCWKMESICLGLFSLRKNSFKGSKSQMTLLTGVNKDNQRLLCDKLHSYIQSLHNRKISQAFRFYVYRKVRKYFHNDSFNITVHCISNRMHAIV